MNKRFTPGEFLKKLAEGALWPPLIREGFAKPIEGRHDAFLFAPGTSCEGWTEIPGEFVEDVEVLGERSCRDHSHPLIRIHFREPSEKEAYATVLIALLRASDADSNLSHVLMSPVNPFIGEWLARIIADFGDAGGQRIGGSDISPADIAERKNCIALRRRCLQGDLKACRLLKEECPKPGA